MSKSCTCLSSKRHQTDSNKPGTIFHGGAVFHVLLYKLQVCLVLSSKSINC